MRTYKPHFSNPNSIYKLRYLHGAFAPAHLWYMLNWEPQFTCLHERRLGGEGTGDGPKWVCDPHRISEKAKLVQLRSGGKDSGCLVYSIGCNNDFQFEEAVLREIDPKCEVHSFDHTIKVSEEKKPPGVTFHSVGLESKTSFDSKDRKRMSLPGLIAEFGHKRREIDLLKIDCEGCEYRSFKNWFTEAGILPRQILVEVHLGTEKSLYDDKLPLAEEFFVLMRELGYAIFHKEPNINTVAKGGVCEYSFIRLEADFFKGG